MWPGEEKPSELLCTLAERVADGARALYFGGYIDLQHILLGQYNNIYNLTSFVAYVHACVYNILPE